MLYYLISEAIQLKGVTIYCKYKYKSTMHNTNKMFIFTQQRNKGSLIQWI